MKYRQAEGKTLLATIVSAFMVASAGMVPASATTYFMDQIIGTGSVVGTIDTDGTTGILNPLNLTAWNLQLYGAGGVSYTITNLDPRAKVWGAGSGVTADAANIYFNFSAGSDFLVFQDWQFSGSHYLCEANFGGPCLPGASDVPDYYTSASAQFAHDLSGLQVIASASVLFSDTQDEPGVPAPTPGQGLLACLAIAAFLFVAGRYRSA